MCKENRLTVCEIQLSQMQFEFEEHLEAPNLGVWISTLEVCRKLQSLNLLVLKNRQMVMA